MEICTICKNASVTSSHPIISTVILWSTVSFLFWHYWHFLYKLVLVFALMTFVTNVSYFNGLSLSSFLSSAFKNAHGAHLFSNFLISFQAVSFYIPIMNYFLYISQISDLLSTNILYLSWYNNQTFIFSSIVINL